MNLFVKIIVRNKRFHIRKGLFFHRYLGQSWEGKYIWWEKACFSNDFETIEDASQFWAQYKIKPKKQITPEIVVKKLV